MLHPNDSPQASNNEASSTASLQPMGFTDILDSTFSLYRNHFRLFLGISAVRLFSHIAFSTFTHWASQFCDTVVETLCYSGLTYASAQVYLGRHITVRATFRQVKHRIWPYLGSMFFFVLVVAALVIPFIIGFSFFAMDSILMNDEIASVVVIPLAICFAARWGLYAQAVLVEENSATNALRRSSELVKGAWWRVFGMMFGIMLLANMIKMVLLISSVFIFAFSGIAGEVDFMEMREVLWHNHRIEGVYHLWHIMTTAIEALTIPIGNIGFTLLYFDRRIRKEGFDIEMMLAMEEV